MNFFKVMLLILQKEKDLLKKELKKKNVNVVV